MPRDTAGNYTLPAGNPVASGEIISASWANSTMNDLGQSLSASLDRYGRGGMLAPFQFTDGTESAPGATWSNEPTTGLYRAAYGDLRFTLTGTDVQRWTSANAYLWRNSQWEEILTQTGGGGDTTINNLVVTGSFTSPGIDDNATSTTLTLNALGGAEFVGSIGGTSLGLTGDFPIIGCDSAKVIQVTGGGITVNGAFTSKGIDDNANATAITIDANENVGIGVLAPASKLHIIDVNPVVRMQSNGASTVNALTMIGRALDSSAQYSTIKQVSTNGGQFGTLTFCSGPSDTERMRIDASGYVGIGGASSYFAAGASVLQLNGTSGAYPTRAGVIRFLSQDGTSGQCEIYGTDGGLFFYTGVGGNSNTRLSINAAGTTTVTGGFEAAQPSAGAGAFAAGDRAGTTSQGTYAVAVGFAAGENSQGDYSIASGFAAGQATQGDYAISLGNYAGNDTQGASSVAIGSQAGKETQGTLSVSIGPSAGKENQGDNAIAVGREAGLTSQGNDSVAIGYAAGQTAQGIYGTSVGYVAGNDTQGDYGVAMGHSAGQTTQGSSAVAVGHGAGKITQGASAVAVGYAAGQTTQGDYAVAVGEAAGANTQGDYSVSLGYYSGVTNQGANSIAIGNKAGQTGQGDNGIIINSSGLANNDTNPNHIVLVSGSGKYLLYNGTDTWKFAGGDVTVPNDKLFVGATSVPSTAITGSMISDVQSQPCRFSGSGTASRTLMTFINSNGSVGSISTSGNTTAFTESSDERLKENIVDAPAGNIDDLRVRSFDWKADGEHKDYGFIAQELEVVAPYAVTKGETDEDMWGVDYSKLVPMLVKEIQDLKAEVAALKGA